MGQSSKKRQRFREQHPYCCFCGGVAPTETIDHVPPRVAFDNKIWPEGFEFPACYHCNISTRLLDMTFGLLSHFGGIGRRYTDDETKKFGMLLRGVINNRPGLAESLFMTANEKRATLKDWGIKPPPGGTYRDVPIITLGDRALFALEVLAFKVVCALYYKHAGHPLPAKARMVVGVRTNADMQVHGMPETMHRHTIPSPELVRGTTNLTDQFRYRYRVAHGYGLFLCGFRASFLVEAITSANDEPFPAGIDHVLTVGTYLRGLPPISADLDEDFKEKPAVLGKRMRALTAKNSDT